MNGSLTYMYRINKVQLSERYSLIFSTSGRIYICPSDRLTTSCIESDVLAAKRAKSKSIIPLISFSLSGGRYAGKYPSRKGLSAAWCVRPARFG